VRVALSLLGRRLRPVLAGCRLLLAQVNPILACAELYFSNLNRLQLERRVLTTQIRAAASSADHAGHQAELLLKAPGSNPMRPWLDKLASNIKREHVLRVMLNSFMWGKILSPVQKAKAAVYRWGEGTEHPPCCRCAVSVTSAAPPAAGCAAKLPSHMHNAMQQLHTTGM